MMKRNNNKRNVQFLAAAALTAALVAGQVQPAAVYGGSSEIQVSGLIPDNVTIEQPVPLSDISLPSSDYGTLSWADSSSVPSERVQSYDVVFRPYNSEDLSRISGWDGSSDAIYGSVTVVVSSMEEQESEEEYGDSEEWSEEEGSEDQTPEEAEPEEEVSGEEEQEDPEEDTESETEEEPETTVTPGAEEKPETTPEPEEKPETTVTPGAEEDPEATVTPGAEEKPEVTITPEATVTPEATITPEATVTPEATITPEVTVTPEATITPEADKDNIFDREENKEDERSTEAEQDLSKEEQEAAAAANHSCNGISVSGINLPWYVQFRATSGENYQFTNEDEANVFKSYEFELWDLKNNTEYQIPDGEYISVTVPVKAGYKYTIEHLLDSGAMETIVPSVEGSTMVFSTHSFSPFGIAGSRPLVGEEIQEDGYDSTEVRPTATPVPESSSSTDTTLTPAEDEEGTENTSGSDSSAEDNNTESSSEDSNEDQGDSISAVNTGDRTPIIAFVVLAAAALVIVGVILFLRKRK